MSGRYQGQPFHHHGIGGYVIEDMGDGNGEINTGWYRIVWAVKQSGSITITYYW